MRIILVTFALFGMAFSVCQAAILSATPSNVESKLAAAKSADTVRLAAGLYDSKAFLIEKPLTLEGAGIGKTIITAGFRAWEGAPPTGIHVNDIGGVTIRNLTVSGISTTDGEPYFGILVDVSSALKNITIDKVEVAWISWAGDSWISGMTGNAIGVKVWSGNITNGLDKLTITNCRVHDSKLGSGEAISLGGKVTNFTIKSNIVERVDNIGIDAVGGYEWFNGVAANGTISFNTVRGVNTATNPAYAGDKSAAGIYVDGGQNITVSDNTIETSNFGISISSENTGTNARFNKILKNKIISPTEFAFNVGGDTGTVGTGFAFDNVFTSNIITGSPSQTMILFGRTKPYLAGSKANDWTSNSFTWKNKPSTSGWWTNPATNADINIGDIQTDKTNKFYVTK
jgi:hypothetical protein